jgi:hypothetical protein
VRRCASTPFICFYGESLKKTIDAGDTTDPVTNDPVTESHRGLVGSLHGESNLSISSLFYYTESCLESLESNPLSPSHLLNLAMYVVNNIKQSVLIASNLRVVLL